MAQGRGRARTGRPGRGAVAIAAVAAVLLAPAACRTAETTSGGTGSGAGPAVTSRTVDTDGTSGTTATDPPGTTGPGSTAGTTSTTVPGFDPEPLAWSACTPTPYQCATLTVPLDHTKPEADMIEIPMKRHPATNPAGRIGSVFFNPGGPGASGIDSLSTAVNDLSPDVRAAFDIVSWDPRAVGGSTEVRCEEGLYDFYAEDLTIDDPSPAAEDAAKEWGELCADQAGAYLNFVGTMDTVHDLDVMRKAVGDDKLNYLGVSYGTLIGIVYANQYPGNIRAMILDGVVDPTLDDYEANITQSKSIDDSINRFAEQCRQDPSCPIKADPLGAIDQLNALSRQGALHGVIGGQSRIISPTLAELGVVVATYDSSIWPELAIAIDQALKGDTKLFAVFIDAYLSSGSSGAQAAIACLDSTRPTAEEIDEAADRAAQVAPRTGRFNANSGMVCQHWPVDPKPLPDEWSAPGAPPIMVWGTTGDNATPYQNAVHIAEVLPDARLVTLEDDRHAALGANSCVTSLQGAFLLTLALPPEGTTC